MILYMQAKEVRAVKVKIKKQPEKYLKKTDTVTYKKLINAIEGLKNLEGDIIKLKGSEKYRLKIYHYRVIFTCDSEDTITIEEIGSRGDIY